MVGYKIKRVHSWDLKATVQGAVQETKSIARQDAKARSETGNLDQQVMQAQSKFLKLRQRERQLWLIPDKSAPTKPEQDFWRVDDAHRA